MTEQKAPVEQSVEPVVPTEVQEQKSTIAYETHRKLLDEKKRVQSQLDQLMKEKQESQEAEARKRGDFEALLKSREEELAKERSQRQELSDRISNGMKMSSVLEALGGQVDSKWYKLIDVSEIAINPESNEIDHMTVARVAESLKKQWPEMIRSSAKLPSNAPQGLQGGTGKIAESEWKKMKSIDQRKYGPNDVIWGY
jgi:hypothetical protein